MPSKAPAARTTQVVAGVDVGGTFTDSVTYDPATGEVRVFKTLTTHRPAAAVVDALAGSSEALRDVSLICHATTMATNALLTRTGLAKTALVTNRGFRDVLEIARQRRPELYDIGTRRPPPLVRRAHRFTVPGRTMADGSVSEGFDAKAASRVAGRIAKEGFEAVAVCFLNSYANPAHELMMRRSLRRAGFSGYVSLSSEVDREYREYERTSTTVVNAALTTLFSGYLSDLSLALKEVGVGAQVFFMNSDGGMSPADYAATHPVSVIESGPAAGVLAAAFLARRLKMGRVLTLDMGGTTAKAGAIVFGEPKLTNEFEAAGRTHSGRSIKGSGYAVRGPTVDLAEVSSGGGTIAWVDEGGALKVGPGSSGSDPGPACYGRGGAQPTVTDANVLLGRINPERLLGGQMPIHKDLAESAFRPVSERLGTSVEETAMGVVRLANNQMAKAILIVSVERGLDPRDFSMAAFGGAGPIHSCDLAEELGVKEVVIPSHPGLFSAYGLLVADIARNFSLPVQGGVDETFLGLEKLAREAMRGEGFPMFRVQRYVEARYAGQSHELTLVYRPGGDLRRQFDGLHRRLYGYSSPDALEFVNARLRARVPRPLVASLGKAIGPSLGTGPGKANRRAWLSGRWVEATVHRREGMAGSRGAGPCIIEEYDSTIVVNPSWKWAAEEDCVRLTR